MIANLFVLTGIKLRSVYSASQSPQLHCDFNSRAVLQLHLDNLHFPLQFATAATIKVMCYDGDAFYLPCLGCEL